jgi:hypothetical protein
VSEQPVMTTEAIMAVAMPPRVWRNRMVSISWGILGVP